MIDETTDISEETLCSIIARLVESNSAIKECFLGYDVNKDRTADGLCIVLCKAHDKKFNIQNKLIALT